MAIMVEGISGHVDWPQELAMSSVSNRQPIALCRLPSLGSVRNRAGKALPAIDMKHTDAAANCKRTAKS
jgi:hypothetical protein